MYINKKGYYLNKKTEEVQSYDDWVIDDADYRTKIGAAMDDEDTKDTRAMVEAGDLIEIQVLHQREAEDCFNDFLDECYESVDVGGYKMLVSDIWKNCDPTLYRIAMQEWLDDEDCPRVIKPWDWSGWDNQERKAG